MRNTAELRKLISGKLKSRSRSNPSLLITILMSLATLATPAFSRSPDALMGTILGTVRIIRPNGQSNDATGAKVRLESTAQTNSLFVLADDSGEFKFGSVPPGSYKLEVALEGFEDTARMVTIHAGETAVENIQLEIKRVYEEVTIDSTRGGVDAIDAESASELKQAKLQTVSLGSERFHQNALPLTPVAQRGPGGLMKIKLSRMSQSGLRIDRTILMNYASQRGKLRSSFEGSHFTESDIVTTKPSPPSVSSRYETVHFPRSPSLQMRVLKTSFRLRASPGVSLSRSHVYPRDFRGDMDSANLGISNGVGGMFGIRFVIEKEYGPR